MFVDTLAEDLSFDRAIDTYIREMAIPEPLASVVATRTLVVLGQDLVPYRRRAVDTGEEAARTVRSCASTTRRRAGSDGRASGRSSAPSEGLAPKRWTESIAEQSYVVIPSAARDPQLRTHLQIPRVLLGDAVSQRSASPIVDHRQHEQHQHQRRRAEAPLAPRVNDERPRGS